MGWLLAGAVGNEDEAHTEEKYSVLKHTFVRSPIVSIVTIKVRGSIKFCMHFLHQYLYRQVSFLLVCKITEVSFTSRDWNIEH